MARTLVLLAAVAFGTTGTARALGPDASPVAVGAARVIIGAALLGVVAWRVAPRSDAPWSRRALLAGALGIAGYQLAFFAAVRETGVAVGTVVALGSGPAFAGLFSRAPLTGRWAASTALATAGIALLVGAGAVLLVPALFIAGTGWLAAPGGIALAVYLAAVPTALAYVLFARGLRH